MELINKKIENLNLPASVLIGEDIPPVREYMKASQKNGKDLYAEEIFNETWDWLNNLGCAEKVNIQLINQYAMSIARQIQCEQCISDYGFLAKHPTTGNAIASPYVSMLQMFTKQANQTWEKIYQVVKDNSVETPKAPQNPMDKLLSRRK